MCGRRVVNKFLNEQARWRFMRKPEPWLAEALQQMQTGMDRYLKDTNDPDCSEMHRDVKMVVIPS